MAKLTVAPRSYQEAVAALNGKDGMTIGHNTRMYRRNGTVRVQLHLTNIVTFQPTGTIIINSGSWRTVTTKDRINQLLPDGYCVFQRDYAWFLCTPSGVVPFVDGMEI